MSVQGSLMASDGLCFVCRQPIVNNDVGIRSIEFVGDAIFERGRYATHMHCAQGLRYAWLERAPDESLQRTLYLSAPTLRLPWYKRVLVSFFAWGLTKLG